MRNQKGFTLIELIMVIVILGILAAFALPKFADLSGEARYSALNGALGSVRSASAIAHSAAITKNLLAATGQTVNLEGTDIALSYGYIDSKSKDIKAAAQLSDEFVLTETPGFVRVGLGKCSFLYRKATATTNPAVISSIIDINADGTCSL